MHTPGPWIRNKYGGIGGEPLGMSPLIVLSEGLAEAKKEDVDLILAAPDLLRACKQLLAISLPHDVSGNRMRDEAAAAIAKAEGRQPRS